MFDFSVKGRLQVQSTASAEMSEQEWPGDKVKDALVSFIGNAGRADNVLSTYDWSNSNFLELCPSDDFLLLCQSNPGFLQLWTGEAALRTFVRGDSGFLKLFNDPDFVDFFCHNPYLRRILAMLFFSEILCSLIYSIKTIYSKEPSLRIVNLEMFFLRTPPFSSCF